MDFLAVLTWLHCLHTLFVLPLSLLAALRQLVLMSRDSQLNRDKIVAVHTMWALSPMLGAALGVVMSLIGVNKYGVHEEFAYILIYTLLLVPISASWVWSLHRSFPYDGASIDSVRCALFGVSLWTVCVLGVTLFWWANTLTF